MLHTLDNWLQEVSFTALIASIAMCILAALFWKIRGWAADLLYCSTRLWLCTLWLSCALDLYHAWGPIAVGIGILLGGFGVIPVTLLCFLIERRWVDVFYVVFTCGLLAAGELLRTQLKCSHIARQFLAEQDAPK
jgi:hypothetical protein